MRPTPSSIMCFLCLHPKTIADFVQLHRARYGNFSDYACWFFHHPIHNKSNETNLDLL
ncbi:hypothetical protein ZWY2020_027974 [Hordeum vulgare]|nr:hypothetical protein ZWY2020_027974 [Hordeum vulgare]